MRLTRCDDGSQERPDRGVSFAQRQAALGEVCALGRRKPLVAVARRSQGRDLRRGRARGQLEGHPCSGRTHRPTVCREQRHMMIDNGDGTRMMGPLDVVLILQHTATGRYHVCLLEEAPPPGPLPYTFEMENVRLRSKMTHTEGTSTLV